jgi:hypothetical protein
MITLAMAGRHCLVTGVLWKWKVGRCTYLPPPITWIYLDNYPNGAVRRCNVYGSERLEVYGPKFQGRGCGTGKRNSRLPPGRRTEARPSRAIHSGETGNSIEQKAKRAPQSKLGRPFGIEVTGELVKPASPQDRRGKPRPYSSTCRPCRQRQVLRQRLPSCLLP